MNHNIFDGMKAFNLFDIEESRNSAVPLSTIFHDKELSNRYVDLILDLSHSKGSRELNIIKKHVNWIHETVFENKPRFFVDIGCGVGFYTYYLCELGSQGLGIDIMSKAISYAIENHASPSSKFLCADFLDFDFPDSVDCFLFIYSIFNTLEISLAKQFLQNINRCLNPGGVFYFEPFKFTSYEKFPVRHWDFYENSLFHDAMHLILYDTLHNQDNNTITSYNHIVTDDGHLTTYKSNIQLYTHQQYQQLLHDAGFNQVEFLVTPDFINKSDDKDYMAIKAIK